MRIIPGSEPEQHLSRAKNPEETASSIPGEGRASVPALPSTSVTSVSAVQDHRQGWTLEVRQQTALLESDLRTQADGLVQTVAQQMQTLMHSTQRWEDAQQHQLHFSVEDLKTEWHHEFQSLEKMFHTEHDQWVRQLKEKDAAIEKLSAELTATRKLIEMQMTQPVAKADPPPEKSIEFEVSKESVHKPILPSFDVPSKKGSFFSKVWNYLNQSAIEIPRRPQD